LSSSLLLDHFVVRLLNGRSLLDVGCGKGKWGFLARLNAQFLVKEPPKEIVGCDVFLPYLRFVNCLGEVYNALVLCDARFLPFRSKGFDIVLVAELLEHLSKKNGEKVLMESERVARKRIILTTPQYPLPQATIDKNVYQKHVSRYTAKELQKRGFIIQGVGLRILQYVLPIILPKAPLKFSYLLVAYKDLHAVPSLGNNSRSQVRRCWLKAWKIYRMPSFVKARVMVSYLLNIRSRPR
jgi:ubiquinone/menaquinone biosynthesis C-methylase UbiE